MQPCPSDMFSDQILSALREYNILIISGETGSGKTTRVPFYVFFSSLLKGKALICSQPRRLAAISVAKRIASEAKVTLGTEIGYLIRFENCTSKKTKIKFTTDGFLLREFISSPCLDQYSMIIIDEAHERSSNTDLILSLTKSLAELRPDLKILITSATLEIQRYSVFFDHCPVFCIPGRSFSVKTFFTKTLKKNFLMCCLSSLVFLIEKFHHGDILVFLTGKNDIDFIGHHLYFLKTLNLNKKGIIIVPIFSGLPWKTQMKSIQISKKKRKIILSTNITETSLTIPNISFILDPGLMKHQIFDPRKLAGDLILTHIGKVNAIQRKGRAGRVRPGKCFRLYTKWSFQNEMEILSVPEVKKIDLSHIVLFLKVLGIEDISSLEWIDFPEKFSLIHSFEVLYLLKALGKDGQITNLGRKMSEFPVNPMLGKTIISGLEFKREKEILRIISLLLIPFNSYHSMFKNNPGGRFDKMLSDHILLGVIFQDWENSGFSFEWCLKNKVDFKNMKLSKDINFQLLKTGKKIKKKIICKTTPKQILDAK